MFINESVNLDCLLTWFSNCLPMCAGRGAKKRILYRRRACEAHRGKHSAENNQSERRMLKSWLDVCRQTEQRPEKNWCRHIRYHCAVSCGWMDKLCRCSVLFVCFFSVLLPADHFFALGVLMQMFANPKKKDPAHIDGGICLKIFM